MIKTKKSFVRVAVMLEGKKFYEMYNRTKVSVFGVTLYVRDEYVSRERALEI